MNAQVVEVDARELAMLKRQAGLAEKMYNDPVHGMDIKRALKAIEPNANIPELALENTHRQIEQKALDAQAALDARIAAFERTQQEREDRVRAADEDSKIARELDAAQRKYSLSDAGRQKAIERMIETKSTDVEAASAWVRTLEPRTPTGNSFAPQALDYGKTSESGDNLKALNEEVLRTGHADKWFDKTVASVLNDPQFQNQY